jgi:hypothetical protein
MSVYLFDQNGNLIGIVEANDELPPDYIQFYNQLQNSRLYSDLLDMPATPELVFAVAIFISRMQDAMNGRENREAMQGAITRLLGRLNLVMTEAHKAELVALMAANNLASIYTLTPPPQ